MGDSAIAAFWVASVTTSATRNRMFGMCPPFAPLGNEVGIGQMGGGLEHRMLYILMSE